MLYEVITIIRPAVDFFDTQDEAYTDGSNAKLAVDFIKSSYNFV